MSHRKWRETEQSHHISCCLVSPRLLCDILSSHPVLRLMQFKCMSIYYMPAVGPALLHGGFLFVLDIRIEVCHAINVLYFVLGVLFCEA